MGKHSFNYRCVNVDFYYFEAIMGWDTQITIIAENTKDRYTDIARLIYEEDAKEYTENSIFTKICYQERDGNTILFFTFERRKYIPYWAIEEISAKYPDVSFTVLGSSPDFLAGPAGIVRISGGTIIDSYGFRGKRQAITDHDDATGYVHPDLLCNWFGKGKSEELIRQRYSTETPLGWCDGDYHTKDIIFTETEMEQLEQLIVRWRNGDERTVWKEIHLSELVPLQ